MERITRETQEQKSDDNLRGFPNCSNRLVLWPHRCYQQQATFRTDRGADYRSVGLTQSNPLPAARQQDNSYSIRIADSMKFDLEAHGTKSRRCFAIRGCRCFRLGTDPTPPSWWTFSYSPGKANDAKGKSTLTAQPARVASEGEYFHALRDARQKFSILAIREISQATKPDL